MIKKDFNCDWTFSEDAGSWFAGAEVQNVTLPHDAMILEERNAENPSGPAGGFFPGGNYQYTKMLEISPEDSGKTFILQFEGVYNRAWISVNGALAGTINSGYDELTVDITPYLYIGIPNQISVKVMNSDLPNSRWYTGSGIIRPVHLYVGGPVRIDVDGLRISTPQVGSDVAEVLVKTNVCCDEKNKKIVGVCTDIIAPNGEIVSSDITPVTLENQGVTTVTRPLFVEEPALWSTEAPSLYTCRVTIMDGQDVADVSESSFGIRKIELDPVNGLRLNGEKILLRGGCIHHDNGIIGAATISRAEERRIEILKEAGFNSVRISHNSSSRALLEACDRLGMLVMEESFDMWNMGKSKYDHSLNFADNWGGEVERIVAKDFNHPSVFMYSIGNEIQELAVPEGARLSRRIAEKFREQDSTRFVTNAINSLMAIGNEIPKVMKDLGYITEEQMEQMTSRAQDESGSGNVNDVITQLMGMMNMLSAHPMVEERFKETYGVLDLVGMNYMRGAYRLQADINPNRVFYGSETFNPDIDLNWKEVKEIPACIGDYCWTAWDYLGESGIGVAEYNGIHQFQKPYPVYLAYCGDVDITGFRRPTSYYREIVFGLRKKPYIAVQLPEYYGVEAQCTPWATRDVVSSWTWNGYEGKPCVVEVYSDAIEVELFLNNESLGKKPAGEANRFKAEYDITYNPGTLEAVSYYEDGTITREHLNTANKTAAISANADRDAIGVGDLSYITLELVDENGVVNTSDNRKISVTVSGDGYIQGFGSADYKSEENFFDETRTPYYGRAVIAVRGNNESGTIIVKVEAEGLESAFVEICVKG